MAALAKTLLKSQQLTHFAAIAERDLRQQGITERSPVVARALEDARSLAGHFAVYADFFPAANDEPPLPETA